MPLHAQLSLSYRPFNCSACGSYFWMKPAKAQALTAANKSLWCRTCQEARGWNVPWPAARRLTDDELTELQMEAARNGLAYDHEDHTPPQPSSPLPPSPSPMEKSLSLAGLRDRLSYHLDVSSTPQKEVAQGCGFTAQTVSYFLKGNGMYPRNRLKLEAYMQKRGWLQPIETKGEPSTEQKLDDLADLRMRLRNSLQASGMSPWRFGKAAGFSGNPGKTVTSFIEGTGKRAPMGYVVKKIEKGMAAQGWLKDEAATPVAPDTAAQPPLAFVEVPVESIAGCEGEALTNEERYTVIASVMTQVPEREIAVAILDKLFPSA